MGLTKQVLFISSATSDIVNFLKFHLSIHKDNAYDVFNEFVEMFWYEYDAIAKEPPVHGAISGCIDRTKSEKMFLKRFTSQNLQSDYEDVKIPLKWIHYNDI